MNGILVSIEPVIFRFGPLVVRWSGLFFIAAVTVGILLTARRAASLGVGTSTVLELASWIVPSGFIGARLLYIVEEWEYFFTRPAEALDLSPTGLNAWGGLAAGAVAAWLLCRRRGLSLLLVADAAAPGVALAEALARVGSFLNGDGQGLPSSLPWATLYLSENALTPDVGVPRHPAQLYQGLADIVIFGLLWTLRDVRIPVGTRACLFLGLYGASRVFIGSVRLDPPFLLALPLGQLLGLGAAVVGASSIIFLTLRRIEAAAARQPGVLGNLTGRMLRHAWRPKTDAPFTARLYVGPGCGLCDAAIDLLRPYRDKGNLLVSEVDIATDPALLQRYRYSIPVLEIEGGPTLNWPFSRAELDRALM